MKKNKNTPLNIISYIIFVVVGLLTLLPIVYTVLGSFKTNGEMLAHPERLFSASPTLDNYKMAVSSDNFNILRMTWNSLYYSAICTFAVVMTSSMSAYVFARADFPGKKVMFAVLMSLMFITLGGISLYPQMTVINAIGLSNSIWGLIFIKLFSVNVVFTVLIKRYIESLPRALDESAEIDGCSFARIFFNILLPLLKPILATVVIMSFNSTWNDYLLPTIFTMSRPEQRSLIAGVIALKSSDQGASNWTLMLAGSCVSLIPVLIVYIFGNRYMVSGLSAGAVKG